MKTWICTGYEFFNLRNGDEWHRIRRNVAPKMMRPKVVEENLDNFNLVAEDAMARFMKLKETCGPADHIPDLEGELMKFTLESGYVVHTKMVISIWRQLLDLKLCSYSSRVYSITIQVNKIMIPCISAVLVNN